MKDREAWHAAVHEGAKSQTPTTWQTEPQSTNYSSVTRKICIKAYFPIGVTLVFFFFYTYTCIYSFANSFPT